MSFCKLINIVDINFFFPSLDPMKFSLLFLFGPKQFPAVGIYLGLVFLVVLNFDQ